MIRVAAPVVLGQTLLLPIFAAFLKRHPGVKMDCELVDAQLDLSSRGYDLQVRGGPIDHESYVVRDLFKVHRCVVARADHPPVDHPAELSTLPAVRLVTFVPPVITLTHDGGDSFPLRLKTVFSVDNMYAAITTVREGLGFAVLPLFATKRLIASGELRDLCPAWRPPTVQFSITYLPNRLRSRRVDTLIAFLREELTSEQGLGIAFLGQEGVRDTVTIRSGN